MIRVHVYGAAGYAAAEVIGLLCRHPNVALGALESASHAGQRIGAHFETLRLFPRSFDPAGAVLEKAASGDVVILCASDGIAKIIAPQLLERGARVIDLSGDFRIGCAHAVYGYGERYSDAICGAQLVANPGCYPTATLLATLPLAPFQPRTIIVDAKSGLSGAGRKPTVESLFAEVTGNVRAYGLNGHRHENEILEQWKAAGIEARLVFTPHVVPIIRGILVDAYAVFEAEVDAKAIRKAFERAYKSDPSIRILQEGQAPSITAVARTNAAEITISVFGDIVRILCAIDNLGRGAAGQAVRNLNIMFGFPRDLAVHV